MSRGSGWYSSPLRHILERQQEAELRAFNEMQEQRRKEIEARAKAAQEAAQATQAPEIKGKPRIKAKTPQRSR